MEVEQHGSSLAIPRPHHCCPLRSARRHLGGLGGRLDKAEGSGAADRGARQAAALAQPRGTGGCAAAGCSGRRNSVSAQAGGSTTGQAPSANSATQPVCRMRVSGFKAQKYQLSIIFGLFLNFMYICSLALRGSHTEHVQTHVR